MKALEGRVVSGKGIGGAVIGFPTANLRVEGPLPGRGVYAARATVDGAEWAAVVNIGAHPTVPEGEPTVEAHLLDFTGDLYGREVALSGLSFLRPERRFASVDALRAQIARDVEAARKLKNPNP